MADLYENTRLLYQAYNGYSDKGMPPREILEKLQPFKRLSEQLKTVTDALVVETLRHILKDAENKDPSGKYIESVLKTMIEVLDPKHTYAQMMKDAEDIHLDTVFDGGANLDNSNPNVIINDLDEAIEALDAGRIAGFQVGRTMYDKFMACGIVRKWGSAPSVVQVKHVNSLGQEGSGVYGNMHTQHYVRKYIDDMVDLATIPLNGLTQRHLKATGRPPLTEDECRPEFKAL